MCGTGRVVGVCFRTVCVFLTCMRNGCGPPDCLRMRMCVPFGGRFLSLSENTALTGLNPALCPLGAFKLTSTGCFQCGPGRWGGSSSLTSLSCSSSCNAGYACPPGSSNATAVLCPAGQYSAAGAASCINCSPGWACLAGSGTPTLCQMGKYSMTGASVCVDCPAGVFGNTTGLTSAACTAACAPGLYGAVRGLISGTCTGSCDPGYACPAGSTNSTVTLCSAGLYSAGGQGTCTLCPAGVFGNRSGLATAACTAPCPAGRFGAVMGASAETCSGLCSAGYFCVAGSTNATAAICPVGRYSSWGAGACEDCPVGLFGNTSGLNSPECSGPCPAGRFGMHPGMASATCSGLCRAGFACSAGSPNSTAIVCAAGFFSLAGAPSCTSCGSGRFGATPGMNSASCSGLCDAGYYCPLGSTNATALACPPGRYSVPGAASCTACPGGTWFHPSAQGLTSVSCGGDCTAGYSCPAGSTNATALLCPAGQYSTGGAAVCTACAGGQFGALPGMNTSACSGMCTPGFACPARSTNATALLCPAGQYSTGGAAMCTACPGGQFGALLGMNTSACSGMCTPGFACPAGSTNAASLLCPAGTFSTAGAASCTACPAAFPFSRAGAASAASCSACASGCDDTFGRFPCVDTSWTLWYDVVGVEAAHRFVMLECECGHALVRRHGWVWVYCACSSVRK